MRYFDGCDWDGLRAKALNRARSAGAGDNAEDVAQEALISFLRCSGHLGIECAEAYVIAKAGWLAIDIVRSEASRYQREGEWASLHARQGGMIDGGVRSAAVLASIPAHLRRVAELRAEGYTYREMGVLLGVSKPAVQRRMAELRRRLAA